MESSSLSPEGSTALVPAVNALVPPFETSQEEWGVGPLRQGLAERVGTSIGPSESTALGGRPTYLCFEGPKDRVRRAAEVLANRGVEASVLTLPGPVAEALLGEESPYAHTPTLTSRSPAGLSANGSMALEAESGGLYLPLDRTPLVGSFEEEPSLSPGTGLVEGWHEQQDYLWQHERIDVGESFMPPGYYAKRMGTCLEVDGSGHSRWKYDPQWRPVEVSRRPPRRFKTRIVIAELEGTRSLLIRSGEKVIACRADSGSKMCLYEDPRSGLYKVEGRAGRFTYWTETREAPALEESMPTEEERDPLITLDELDEPTQAWLRKLLKQGPASIADLIAIQQAWQQRFDYDARYGGRGATSVDYVRNLLQRPKGVCAEAGEGLAVLFRLCGNPSRVWEGYHYESFGGRLASHRWPSVLSGGQWMRMEGTPPKSTFVSLNFQPMPLYQPVEGGLREQLLNHLEGVATRQNMVRLAVGTALVGAMAGLVGAGMMIQDRCQVLGSDTSTEHP